MRQQIGIRLFAGIAVATGLAVLGGSAAAQAPLAIDSARITISGTSNVHPYTASTTTVRVTRAQLAGGVPLSEIWAAALKPGGVDAFEIAIPAAALTSPREGLDKNMHKALQVADHPDILFRLIRIDTGEKGLQAVGVLTIAGVQREITMDITTERKGATLGVQGRVQILMTDFGIKPPVAMLGMLKTDPKVTITFETVLAVPLT